MRQKPQPAQQGENNNLYKKLNYLDLAITRSGATAISELSYFCLLYTSPSPRDATLARMPSSA